MGDQRLEWQIQEEEDDDVDQSSSIEESKMSMMLSKGWRLGKKIVITGMAISSAPIVLPPLMIFSTIGFAFAVPFGFVFFSYACTEKLMSKLLSRPLPTPPLLDYQAYDDVQEEEDFEEDGNDGEFMDGDYEEEEKFREDTEENMEMRIELIEDEKGDEGFVVSLDQEKPVEDVNGVMEEESRDGTYFDNYVEEEEEEEEEEKPVEDYVGDIEEEDPMRETGGVMEGYRDEEEVGEIIEEEEKPEATLGSIEEEELLRKEMGEISDEENADDVVEFEESAVKENGGSIEEEVMKSGRETEGILEKSRDEGNVGMTVEEKEKSLLGMEGEKSDEHVHEGEKPLEVAVENKGGSEDIKNEEPLDKPVAAENIEEQKAEERVGDVAQEDYIVEDAVLVVDVAQEDYIVKKVVPVVEICLEEFIVEEAVPVVDVAKEDYIVEEAVPVVHIAQEDYIVEEAVPVVDVAQKDHIPQEAVPVAEINGVTAVIEEEKSDDESAHKFANNIEKVRPMEGSKGVMEESGDGVNVEKKIENEEIPIEDIHGTIKVEGHEGVNNVLKEDTPIEEPIRTKEDTKENLDRIALVDTNGGVDERRDEAITDGIVEEEMKPTVETEKRSVATLDHEVDSLPRHEVDSLEQASIVEEPITDNLTKGMSDSAGHPLSAEMGESKSNKDAPEPEITIPSKEVLYSKDKIWEQIDAMRKIVGYKAALQATCIEELKALYVFTGVEPPIAFKDPSDLAEINDKLRLLMSIIGVK